MSIENIHLRGESTAALYDELLNPGIYDSKDFVGRDDQEVLQHFRFWNRVIANALVEDTLDPQSSRLEELNGMADKWGDELHRRAGARQQLSA